MTKTSKDFVVGCGRAREAQRDWAATPAPRRGRAIQQIGRIVEANKEALARIVGVAAIVTAGNFPVARSRVGAVLPPHDRGGRDRR